MSLLAAFLAIVRDWRGVFPRQPTFQRGVRQALGSLICLGRRCLTRIIWTNGGLESQLERGVFPPLALPVGAATVVPAHPETSVETRGGVKVAGGTGPEREIASGLFLFGGWGYGVLVPLLVRLPNVFLRVCRSSKRAGITGHGKVIGGK
jgi:hypothetical protein